MFGIFSKKNNFWISSESRKIAGCFCRGGFEGNVSAEAALGSCQLVELFNIRSPQLRVKRWHQQRVLSLLKLQRVYTYSRAVTVGTN